MKIGIDARTVVNRRGIGNVVFHLLQGLSAIPADYSFVLYVDNESARDVIPADARFTVKVLRPRLYPIWEQFSLPWHAWRDGLDMLHCPGNSAPLFLPRRLRLILSIMDVMFMFPESVMPKSPSMYQRLGRKYLEFVVPRVAKRATAITTISNTSRNDILQYIDVPEKLISVVWLAANSACKAGIPSDVIAKTLASLGIDRPFALALGAIDPRKNTATILRAFAYFRQRAGRSLQLVVIGLKGGQAAAFRDLAEQLGIAGNVVFAPFVSEEDLGSLYNAAEFLVYPSLYEGFGLPIVEAMVCGTPVITGPSGSIPEIAGDAAMMVDPNDVQQIGEAMLQLEHDPQLRNTLVERGLRRGTMFSWQRAAEKIFSVYESARAA